MEIGCHFEMVQAISTVIEIDREFAELPNFIKINPSNWLLPWLSYELISLFLSRIACSFKNKLMAGRSTRARALTCFSLKRRSRGRKLRRTSHSALDSPAIKVVLLHHFHLYGESLLNLLVSHTFEKGSSKRLFNWGLNSTYAGCL